MELNFSTQIHKFHFEFELSFRRNSSHDTKFRFCFSQDVLSFAESKIHKGVVAHSKGRHRGVCMAVDQARHEGMLGQMLSDLEISRELRKRANVEDTARPETKER